MKQNLSFLFITIFFFSAVTAQEGKIITGYAITAAEKGQNGWREVRLLNFITGEVIKTIYSMGQEIEILNARTGKSIIKKNIDPALEKRGELQLHINYKVQSLSNEKNTGLPVRVRREGRAVDPNMPFATNSAAMAYDKKHERLYYTPMGINQLRYIDLKSKTPRLYYFEEEAFGTVSGVYDIPNQVTRMVIASDGNGYALTNSADHLIQFTTGKKPAITDLGPLSDDAGNGKITVHSRAAGGGDMIADASGNLYLITANRRVYKIPLETKVAAFLGSIKGLPDGYNTNGAMVEDGGKVIVCSAESTVGYFRFDLLTLQAEKISTASSVYNASDLANGILAFDKKNDRKESITLVRLAKPVPLQEIMPPNGIAVYPNPVSNGLVKISFTNKAAGKYQLELMNIAGQVVSSKEITVSNKIEETSLRLPENIAKGTYLLKVTGGINKVSTVTKLIIQ